MDSRYLYLELLFVLAGEPLAKCSSAELPLPERLAISPGWARRLNSYFHLGGCFILADDSNPGEQKTISLRGGRIVTAGSFYEQPAAFCERR